MKVSLSNRPSSVDDDAREDIRGRIYLALSRFSLRIDEGAVQIGEVNGGRASTQWLCRSSVPMKQLGSFSVESIEVEPATTVSRAAGPCSEAVQRILARRRDETGLGLLDKPQRKERTLKSVIKQVGYTYRPST